MLRERINFFQVLLRVPIDKIDVLTLKFRGNTYADVSFENADAKAAALSIVARAVRPATQLTADKVAVARSSTDNSCFSIRTFETHDHKHSFDYLANEFANCQVSRTPPITLPKIITKCVAGKKGPSIASSRELCHDPIL